MNKSLDQWEAELGNWASDSTANGLNSRTAATQPSGDGLAAETRAEDATTRGLPASDSRATNLADSHSSPSPIAAASLAAPRGTPWLDSVEQAAMACEFEVLLNHGQYPQGVELARNALQSVHVLEELLSIYRPTSEFCTINRFGHQRPVATRIDVCRLLLAAACVSQVTGRAFDITAGTLSSVWGFSRRQGRKPDDTELAEALSRVGAHLVHVDLQALTVQLAQPGVQLNPGGIGKGYALDRVAGQLRSVGIQDFLLHGGRSSIAACGQRYHAAAADNNETPGGWWIALAHPLRWEEKLGRIRLRNQALGTSGAGKQFFHYQGVRYSHVIDPRTGWPAQGVLSATAICRSGTLADALATAFMVMGPAATASFCEQHPQIGAILVIPQSGSSRMSIVRYNVADEDWCEQRMLEI